MTETVLVNGVTLTRAQVEEAVKQLNQPDPLKHLDQVVNRHGGRRGVVIIGEAQQAYVRGVRLMGKITVIDEYEHGFTYSSDENAQKQWKLKT